MILKILMAVIAAATMILTPLYVKAQKNGACPRSLALKMIAATGYILIGVLGIKASSEFSRFDGIMLTALALSWIGDLFLHLWQHKIFHAIGFLGFFSAHFFFIASYLNGIKSLEPDRGFFSAPELIFVIAFDVFFVVFAVLTKMELKGVIAVPIIMYATVITTMLCKAVLLGVVSVRNAVPGGTLIACIAASGASLFVMSDFSISVLMFNKKQKTNYKLKMFNMLTYYAAELLLASLVMFY